MRTLIPRSLLTSVGEGCPAKGAYSESSDMTKSEESSEADVVCPRLGFGLHPNNVRGEFGRHISSTSASRDVTQFAPRFVAMEFPGVRINPSTKKPTLNAMEPGPRMWDTFHQLHTIVVL